MIRCLNITIHYFKNNFDSIFLILTVLFGALIVQITVNDVLILIDSRKINFHSFYLVNLFIDLIGGSFGIYMIGHFGSELVTKLIKDNKNEK